VEGSFDKLQQYYDLGVRLFPSPGTMQLLWFTNSLDKDVMNTGLTPFGKEAVE
jgi:microsomal dipeptidase-like Zn-dependent dipeptidase